MNNIKDKLSLIEQERGSLEKEITMIESQFKQIQSKQAVIHQEVKRTSVKEIDKNLAQYSENSAIFSQTTSMIDKVQKLHLEKLVWLNLSIIYSKIAPTGTTLGLTEIKYSNKERCEILSSILEDLTERELYEYCTVVSDHINTLKLAA